MPRRKSFWGLLVLLAVIAVVVLVLAAGREPEEEGDPETPAPAGTPAVPSASPAEGLASHAETIRSSLADSAGGEEEKAAARRAVNALAAAGEAALPEARRLAESAEPEVGREGVRLLTMLGSRASLEALLEECRAEEPEKRLPALKSVGEFPTGKAVSRSYLKEKAEPVLLENLESESVEVRTAALAALARVTGRPLDFEPTAPPPERTRWLAAYRSGGRRDETGAGND
jgi:hypothetical protein